MPLPLRHILSKSTFMYGCQCPKRLWLHKYRPEVRDEMDEEQEAVFQRGIDVGKLAEQLFPGGVDARPETPFAYQQSVADTARYIAEGKDIIYEAAFQYEGLLCAVDILVKQGNQWYAYEVKSTSKVKDQHIPDAAFQYYVITQAGLELADFSIVHLNTSYIRYGDLNVQELFTAESVLNHVLPMQEFIHEKGIALKTVVANKKEMPEVEVGDHCYRPYNCDFLGFCYEGIDDETEEDYGEPYINEEAVRSFLSQLEYPIYHIDFESWRAVVPEYDGHWPFRQVCFQYSVQVERAPGAEPENYAYLAEGTHSSSLEFIESLLGVLGTQGTVLVYNISFEKPRLKELMNEYPQHTEAIQNVIDRIVDLMKPFRKDYRTPEMQGKWTIKKVLPALVPELSYNELTIGNGTDASNAFYHLHHTRNPDDVKRTRAALLEYCKLDTLAMVKLLGVLRGINV